MDFSLNGLCTVQGVLVGFLRVMRVDELGKLAAVILDIWRWDVFPASVVPWVLLWVEVVDAGRCTSQEVPLGQT